jgi:hypothetical protein
LACGVTVRGAIVKALYLLLIHGRWGFIVIRLDTQVKSERTSLINWY